MTEVLGIDHIYIAVSDMATSEAFYDRVLRDVLGFRKQPFELAGDPHVQYFNRHFSFVLRPARDMRPHDAYAPGLHHLCLRVDSRADVQTVARDLQAAGIAAMDAEFYGGYAPDYWATYFSDPDGMRLEVTNYRKERRERFEHWDTLPD
jgi:catechol 2,3-dioxygenase-like lactoylglutathione lyase family enzyme